VVPVSTYRLQLTSTFGFNEAAAAVPYLARLGVTHLYCSPWLQAEPSSAHGYDVVDHSRVNPELGSLEVLTTACAEAGLGIVLDIVPNHMSIATPELNKQWWSVLREGQASPCADWFDIDWTRRLLVPVLGATLEDCLADITVDGERVRYFDHVFPLAPGTLVEGDVAATLERQHYELTHWRESQRLNYRRFFDVTTLAGVRVEVPAVFDATHAVVLDQVRAGLLDGLRVDHPDGLADPAGYLARLRSAAPEAWVVVEKILEPGEDLPDWPCEGTTGYDAMHQVTGLFVEPTAEPVFAGLASTPPYDEVVARAKRQVLDEVLVAEVERLLDLAVPVLAGIPREALREALVELLVGFGVYRAYLPAEGPADAVAKAHVERAAARAVAAVPHRAEEIELLAQLVLAERGCPEFVTRFQQTCGPVMAKGVEDTTFYRYTRLLALNEVGGDPDRFGVAVEEFHDYCRRRLARWPLTMTALSTHDTKRAEDVRARLAVLTHDASAWAAAVEGWSKQLTNRLEPAVEQLIWQTLVGAWPLTSERASAYLTKALREAKEGTSWLDPSEAFEQQAQAVLTEAMSRDLESFVRRLHEPWRATALAQKLVQLTMPGVADCYQGTELVALSLVDPDNRRPVDYERRARLLDQPGADLDGEKLRLVSTGLRLRREHPEWFLQGSYEPLAAPEHTLAFSRAGEVVVAVPLRGGVVATPELPAGDWHDLLPGLPVSLLVRA
jgi:(1->4)-alpha-D-glucan 1-alpha-D-glucosylmutase